MFKFLFFFFICYNVFKSDLSDFKFCLEKLTKEFKNESSDSSRDDGFVIDYSLYKRDGSFISEDFERSREERKKLENMEIIFFFIKFLFISYLRDRLLLMFIF